MKKSKSFWTRAADFILDNRVLLLVALALITAFMGYRASKLQMSYDLVKILPVTDPKYKLYENFKQRFGEDGNVMLVAFEDDSLYTLEHFNLIYDLTEKIKAIDGIKNVMAETSLFNIKNNEELKKFDFVPISKEKPTSQNQLDAIHEEILSLPFYKGLVYSDNEKAHLVAITFNQQELNSNKRISMSRSIEEEANKIGKKMNVEMHFSGMPFIRTNFMDKVSKELIMFMILAFIVTTVILYLFFRSFRVVFFAVMVVLIAVIFSVGLIEIFGYKITILTGLIPPLIMVIGIPNTIFLINKYQEEYIRTKDQLKSLKTSIIKIGKTTFIANLTTFIGFFVFYFTGSPLLIEFGLVAALAVMATWLFSLILIPIIFSYLPPPKAKHVRHLENKNITKFLNKVNTWVHNDRAKIYWSIGILVIIAFFGLIQIKANGYVVDDLPEDDPIYADLKFIEKNFKGVIPFEVSIDTKIQNGVFDPEVLTKIKLMDRAFAKHPEFTKPLSVVEGLKFIYQAFRGGDPKYYRVPGALELNKLTDYTRNIDVKNSLFRGFLDSTNRYTRVSYQSADVGSNQWNLLIAELQPKIDSIFNYDYDMEDWKPEEEQKVAQLTGNGVVFTEGNDYLLSNLRDSTILAIILVCIVMATQFLNLRTILIATIPSVIPLIITAGIMGYFNIPLKPSTILIFSIAFGIASDGTIYFLTKYKDERDHGVLPSEAVTNTIKETGISMFYTAIILFFGFGIFVISGFKGTIYLGLLVSITLLMGMLCNLVLLPSFLLTMDQRGKAKV